MLGYVLTNLCTNMTIGKTSNYCKVVLKVLSLAPFKKGTSCVPPVPMAFDLGRVSGVVSLGVERTSVEVARSLFDCVTI